MMLYAYCIGDPKGVVFYVGKGKGYRVKRHLQGASHSKLVSARIAEIRARGDEPQVAKFECSMLIRLTPTGTTYGHD